MTSLLILGNSHSGALRGARDEFLSLYPEVELSFFAAPGARFKRGRTDGAGRFMPRMTSDQDREIIHSINGTQDVDLNEFDHVLVVGHRPSLIGFGSMGSEFGRLQKNDATRYLLSDNLLRDWVDYKIDEWIESIGWRFRGTDNVTFTDAPYRSVSMLEDEEERQEATDFAAFYTMPHADQIHALYRERIRARLDSAGFGFIDQPENTVSGPYATRPEFCKAPTNADGNPIDSDHRHMNATFGLELLKHFANRQLDLPVRPN